MLEQIADFIEIIQILLIVLGAAGLCLLIFGTYRRQKPLQVKGGYMVVLAAVLYVCGVLIVDKTKKRANEYLNNTYIEINR